MLEAAFEIVDMSSIPESLELEGRGAPSSGIWTGGIAGGAASGKGEGTGGGGGAGAAEVEWGGIWTLM